MSQDPKDQTSPNKSKGITTKTVSNYGKPVLTRSVQRAREELQKRALDLLEDHLNTIDLAVQRGKFEFALEAQRWLLEHIADDDGTRVLDSSIDTKKEESKPVGPAVNIGIQLGGVPQQAVIQSAPTSPLPIVEAKVERITIPEKSEDPNSS